MKKNMKSAIAVALFVAAFAAAISASPNMYFGILNNTSFDLGTVTIYNNYGTPTTIHIPGSGGYPVQIQGGIFGVVINNEFIQKNGQPTNITIPYGTGQVTVQATLTGNQIVIIDQSIIQGDKKPHSH